MVELTSAEALNALIELMCADSMFQELLTIEAVKPAVTGAASTDPKSASVCSAGNARSAQEDIKRSEAV